MRKARSSPTQIWISVGKLEGTYNFAASLFCTAQSLFRTILDQGSSLLSQSCNSRAAAFAVLQRSGLKCDKRQGHRVCCRDLGWNGSSNKHSLEEQPVHLPTTTPSILAPVQLARPGWLPRQAKPSLLRGWRRAWSKCPWPWTWNDKSTIRKVNLSNITQSWMPLGKLEATYNFAAWLFCTAQSLFRDMLQCCSWMSQSCSACAFSCSSCAFAFAVEIWGQIGQTTRTPCLL